MGGEASSAGEEGGNTKPGARLAVGGRLGAAGFLGAGAELCPAGSLEQGEQPAVSRPRCSKCLAIRMW